MKDEHKLTLRNQRITYQKHVDELGTQINTVQQFVEIKYYRCRINKHVKSTEVNMTELYRAVIGKLFKIGG